MACRGSIRPWHRAGRVSNEPRATSNTTSPLCCVPTAHLQSASHFLPPPTPTDHTGRARRRHQSPPPSPAARLLQLLITSGQHLAVRIGSTDPQIARLPFRGLATRDKAEGAPPSGPQTALQTHPTLNSPRKHCELSRLIVHTSHAQSCTTRIAVWARLARRRQALVWLSSSSRCAPSSRLRPAGQTSTNTNVSILRTLTVRSTGGME